MERGERGRRLGSEECRGGIYWEEKGEGCVDSLSAERGEGAEGEEIDEWRE